MSIKERNGETYAVGCVFGENEHFWMDGMLDVTAFYYDTESDRIERTQVGYFGIDGSNLCSCAWNIDLSKENANRMLDGCIKRESESAWETYMRNYRETVHKGDTVRVVRGRKVPKGTEGTVFWTGTRYNQYTRCNEEICGLKNDPTDKNEKPIWVHAEYLQKLNEDIFTEQQREDYISAYVRNTYGYVLYVATDGKQGTANYMR